jgi:opacity protein-like surface antigen
MINYYLQKAILIACCSVIGSTSALASGGDGSFYIGAFGGVGSTAKQSVEQSGVAHKGFSDDGEYFTYDLLVDVDGRNLDKTATVFGGQMGYQWNTGSSFKPAIEVEGSYLSADQRSNLVNLEDAGVNNVRVTTGGVPVLVTDPRTLNLVRQHVLDTPLSAGNHTFANGAKMKMALFTLNGVLTYDAGSKLKPYVGAGIGVAFVAMRDAVSLQTGPGGVETGRVSATSAVVQVNHFNSRDDASDIAFAVQVKGGVRYQLSERISLFAEYRLVRLAATAHTFGSTVYFDHAPTDNWVLRNGAMNLHNGIFGVRYGF